MQNSRLILITGLLQPRGVSNAMADWRNSLSPADRERVRLFRWWADRDINDHVSELARLYDAVPFPIHIAGHSFGGWRAAKFCGELEERGILVATLCLADAVGRNPLFSDIDIPTNVVTLHSWRQTRGKIRGSHLTPHPPTVWATNEFTPAPHAQVDEVMVESGVLQRLLAD